MVKIIYKNRVRLLILLVVFMIISVLLLYATESFTEEYEKSNYSRLLEEEDNLALPYTVYVMGISSTEDDLLTTEEKSTLEREYIDQINYLVKNTFSRAKGVYILGTDLLSSTAVERMCINSFRQADNVFWHYNSKNRSEYQRVDNCGKIKFMDESYGGSEYFEVMGQDENDRNYLPYYYMTMDGSKVSYDEKARRYDIVDETGKVRTLHAMADGTIRLRKTTKFNIKYVSLKSVYEAVKDTSNGASNMYKNAIILIQDGSGDYEEVKSVAKDLADYYIDVIGTIENEATISTFGMREKVLLSLAGVLVIGLAIVFLPGWVSFLIYVAEVLLAFFANNILFEKKICYLPVSGFFITVTFTFLLFGGLTIYLAKLSVRNLPIDAVIRFTNNIVHIEHSMSYSEYLMKNRSEVEGDISASLLLPVMDKESFLLKELSAEGHRNRRFVETEFQNTNKDQPSVVQTRSALFQGARFVAFIPLPVFDVESEGVTYTVIGLKKKLKPQKASYISMMFFSMYIYFKAQHERGEHQRMYFSILSLMISVIDAKDPVTAGHSQRVANISKDIGIWLKLSKSEQFDLEFTALLHDIGKIGVSDYVLNKQSVYTQNDFEQMKYHTIRGAEMLSEVGISEAIIDGVRHHHERVDGKGYPDGLKGEELTLFAKIIKIADVFDALTSKRQYKDAWEMEKALNIIYRGRGTEFDSDIADVFIEHMSPPGWIPPVDEKQAGERRNPNAEKAAKIAKDFFDKYNQYLSVDYPIPSRKAIKIDFVCQNGFMDYDWGETFNNAVFLEEKPMILSFEKNTKSLFFGQSSRDEEVSNVYYYFFKGFVNMGIYLLAAQYVKETLSLLTEAFGEPQILSGQIMVYETKKMRVVFYRTLDDRCLLFYISDYLCGNYVFLNNSSDASAKR